MANLNHSFLALGLVLGGCSDENSNYFSSPVTAAIEERRPDEEPLLALSTEIPSFSGFYCKDGNLLVGLTAAQSYDDAEVIADILRAKNVPVYCYNRDIGLVPPKVIVVDKQFTFLELKSFRDSILAISSTLEATTSRLTTSETG